MAVATIGVSRNYHILLAEGIQRAKMRQRAKFHQNPSIHYGVIVIFRFFKMAAVRHLGFVWGICGPSANDTGWSLGLYQCAKFGCNWCSSFENIKP